MADRKIIFYEDHFVDFFNTLNQKAKDKVLYVLRLIQIIDVIPSNVLKSITGIKNLFEIRIEIESNIYRVFCCFDKGNLIILFNGFQKKTDKTPVNEINKAKQLMKEYFDSKDE